MNVLIESENDVSGDNNNNISITYLESSGLIDLPVDSMKKNSICVFCSNDISGERKTHLLFEADCCSFNDFAKLFKISQETLMQGNPCHDLNLINCHCEACASNIKGALKIVEDIEKLQGSLERILGILKRNLAKSYKRRTVESTRKVDEKGVELVQQTLIQCWSHCRVQVERLVKKSKRQRSVKKKITKKLLEEPSDDQVANASFVCNENDSDFHTDICPTSLDNSKFEVGTLTEKQDKCENQQLNDDKELYGEDNESTKVLKVEGKSQEYPFICDVCGKGYYVKYYLNLHERSHSGEKNFCCDHCSCKFNSKRSLRLHQVKSHGIGKIGKKTKIKESLRGIVGFHKNRSLEWFLCRHCQNRFKSDDFISPDGKFKISIDSISETFNNFSELRKYHVRHCLAKPTEETFCDKCRKVFTSAKSLEAHLIAIHTKVFPYYCEKCGVGKISKGCLNKHMLVHTNAKNFHCEICSQNFKRKVQLKFHMMRHNNDFPFMCDLCGKRFTDRQKLNRHHETHSEDKKFACPQCGKFFVSKNYVHHHIWDTHKKARRPKTPAVNLVESKLNKQPKEQNINLPSEIATTEPSVSFIEFSSTTTTTTADYPAPAEITFI